LSVGTISGGLSAINASEVDVIKMHVLARRCLAAQHVDCQLCLGRPDDVIEEYVTDSNLRRLTKATTFRTTVVLVDENRVFDVVHENVLEQEACSLDGDHFGVVRIRLDPDPVLRTLQGAVHHLDPHHVLFVRPLSQASHTNAMARATGDLVDADAGGALENSNAVVPRLND